MAIDKRRGFTRAARGLDFSWFVANITQPSYLSGDAMRFGGSTEIWIFEDLTVPLRLR